MSKNDLDVQKLYVLILLSVNTDITFKVYKYRSILWFFLLQKHKKANITLVVKTDEGWPKLMPNFKAIVRMLPETKSSILILYTEAAVMLVT